MILPKAFGSLGFKFKEIEIVGPDLRPSTSEPQSLFGHTYNLCEDKIYLKFSANFSITKRGQKTGQNLTSGSDLSHVSLTKRNMGSQMQLLVCGTMQFR